MECITTTKISVSFAQLVILLVLLLSVRRSGAATPNIGNSTTNAAASASALSTVEFDAGAMMLSTWESASTHRILAQTQKLNAYKAVTSKSAACNSQKYSNCVGPASGKATRPCNDYNRCARH